MYKDDGFNPDNFSKLLEVEEKSFWFVSRNWLIIYCIKKYVKDINEYLEVGCGTGYVLNAISANFPNIKIIGTEYFDEGLEIAKFRCSGAVSFLRIDARKIPFSHKFDLIGAFDVIEHINEDHVVLREINKALKLNGRLIITVPQHMWLWSQTDVNSHHIRRYSHKEIQQKIAAAGFSVCYTSSFLSLLLPIMYISRLLKRHNNRNEIGELNLNPLLNRLLLTVQWVEFQFLKIGFKFTVGGSRIVVARKIKEVNG